jgi:hypothetical protein
VTTANSQPLLDLRWLVVAIRRRRRFWLSTAILGLLIGALTILIPTPPTAVTRLLVLHEDDQPTDSKTLVQTDVELLQTTRIAAAALKALHVNQSPEKFLATYQGSGLTNNVLEIRVRGSNQNDAIRRAKALADAFIADNARRLKTSADAEAQALVGQGQRAQSSLNEVDKAISAAASGATQQSPAELDSLYARRADLAAQVGDFSHRADEARIGTPKLAAGTQIIDAPRPVPSALLSTLGTNGGIGLVLGLAAGLALAAVAGVVQDRPALRRDIAENLGASVIAQLNMKRRPAKLLRRSGGPPEPERVAATLVRTVPDAPAEVSLLEIGCPRLTATLAVKMATVLAERGPVAIIDALPGRDVHRTTPPAGNGIRVLDSAQYNAELEQHSAAGDRHIGVGSVEPGTPWTDLEHLGPETILVVRAGHADTAWLHNVARQLADARIPIIGVVLVDPDPGDRTDGTLWDALHTAIRGRADRIAPNQPSRKAGSSEESEADGGAAAGGERPAVPDQATKRLKPVPPDNGARYPSTPPVSVDSPTERLKPIWPGDSQAVEIK